MGTLYENIKSLCDQSGIKPGKMCVEANVSKGLITDLKMGRKKTVQVETAQKIADYFGVSVDRVLGTEEKEKSPTPEGAELSENKKKLIEKICLMDEKTVDVLNSIADQVLLMLGK